MHIFKQNDTEGFILIALISFGIIFWPRPVLDRDKPVKEMLTFLFSNVQDGRPSPFKAEYYWYKALSAIFRFHRRYPYNPFMSCNPLDSSKYYTVDISPTSYIAVLLGPNKITNFLRTISRHKNTSIKYIGYCIIHKQRM